MRCMKKLKLVSFIGIIFCCLFLLRIDVYAEEVKEISREDLQDMVISTALQFFYKRYYSDYEQTQMSKFFNFREHLRTEEVSRTNMYYNDCSSFVTDVYYSTLGYNFDEFAKDINNNLYYTSEGKHGNPKNETLTKQWYMEMFNRGMYPSTNYFAGLIYDNADPKNIVVADFVAPSENEIYAYDESLEALFKPGDIFVYRVKDKNGNTGGHAMLFVGEKFKNSSGNTVAGFIHSTGLDYNVSAGKLNDDNYSIRFADFDVLKNRLNGKKIISYRILRPINKFCEEDSCTVSYSQTHDYYEDNKIGNLNINAEARSVMKDLMLEQYVSSGDTYLGSHASINSGDEVSINLYIKNMSDMQFCYASNPNISDFLNDGGSCDSGALLEYIPTNSAYSRIDVTNKLSENTTFKSCDGCSYDSSNRTITFSLSLEPGTEKILSYVVTANNSDINSDGIKISYDSSSIEMPPISINVNPGIKISTDYLKESINKVDLSSVNSSLDLAKEVYKIAYNIDLNIIDRPLSSLFTKFSGSEADMISFKGLQNVNLDAYFKLKQDKITTKELDKIVVRGMYGGRQLYGDDTGDRVNYMTTFDLVPGDIIMFWYHDSLKSPVQYYEKSDAFIYVGRSESKNQEPYLDRGAQFIKLNEATKKIETIKDENDKYSYQYLKELYDKDLFIVLRPMQSNSLKILEVEVPDTGKNVETTVAILCIVAGIVLLALFPIKNKYFKKS